jgi:hypothetical protein
MDSAAYDRSRTRGRIRRRVDQTHHDNIEVRCRDVPQVVKVVVIPAIVRRAADVHIRSVIRLDHAVFLESVEDHTD